MVVIAAIAIWLWLSRTAMFWILCGSLVLLLALVADIRRSRLSQKEITSGGAAATLDLSRNRWLLGRSDPSDLVDRLRSGVAIPSLRAGRYSGEGPVRMPVKFAAQMRKMKP